MNYIVLKELVWVSRAGRVTELNITYHTLSVHWHHVKTKKRELLFHINVWVDEWLVHKIHPKVYYKRDIFRNIRSGFDLVLFMVQGEGWHSVSRNTIIIVFIASPRECSNFFLDIYLVRVLQ